MFGSTGRTSGTNRMVPSGKPEIVWAKRFERGRFAPLYRKEKQGGQSASLIGAAPSSNTALDGNIYLSLSWTNYTDLTLYPFGGAMVFSPETDEVIAVAEAPNCAQIQDTMVTDAGDFYVSCDPYNRGSVGFENRFQYKKAPR